MLRAALYARFSTEMQTDASAEDQLRICRAYAEKMGAVVVAEFQDAAISGQTMAERPGVRDLMALAKAGRCDVVIAENTDRLSRAGEHSWRIYKRLEAAGVRYVTVNQGEVTKLHVGLSGLMSEMFIEELGKKTRRGQEGVVLSGRAMGSLAYGYRAKIEHDARGDRIPGLREIDVERAETVRGIFRDYAAGVSPWGIVGALNAAGVESPRGGPWGCSTIIGSPKRGLGILRNELYRGVRVWGRLAVVKDPDTGKRRATPGTGSVQRIEVPELRIISEELWGKVQLRLAETALGPVGQGLGVRRPTYLLAGLLRCGVCGGKMSLGSGPYLRCSARAAHGAEVCENTRSPNYAQIEAQVLEGVQANLLHPLAVAEAMRAFNRVMAEGRKAAPDRRGRVASDLADVERRLARLVAEVENGMPWAAVKGRHDELSARKAALAQSLAAEPPGAEIVKLPPNGAALYRDLMGDLGKGLSGKEALASREAVRGLIDSVTFHPRGKRKTYELDVVADMAPVLMGAPETRSRFIQSHKQPVHFRLAG